MGSDQNRPARRTVDAPRWGIWLGIGTVLVQVALGMRITVAHRVLRSFLDIENATGRQSTGLRPKHFWYYCTHKLMAIFAPPGLCLISLQLTYTLQNSTRHCGLGTAPL